MSTECMNRGSTLTLKSTVGKAPSAKCHFFVFDSDISFKESFDGPKVSIQYCNHILNAYLGPGVPGWAHKASSPCKGPGKTNANAPIIII